MNITHDAMLVSLRINAWSGRLYDRQASNHVAAHHDASASAGRYNKRLLPKTAFAALTATMSAARGNRAAGTAGGGSGAVLEAPALVAGLDDLAVVGQAVEQRGGHLGVAEDGWPFAEGEVGGDDDRGALVEPAH